MTRATSVFGARKFWEVFQMSSGGRYSTRAVRGFYTTEERARGFTKLMGEIGRFYHTRYRWCVQLRGRWYLLSSIYPVEILDEKDEVPNPLDVLTRSGNVHQMSLILESQALMIDEQRALIQRVIGESHAGALSSKLLIDLEHSMKDHQ